MALFDSIKMGSSGAAAGGYEVEKSLRFDNASSAYLSRTAGSPTNQSKGTFSCWAKRTKNDHSTLFFGGGGGSQNNYNAEQLAYISSNTLAANYKGGVAGCSVGWYMYGTRKLRDLSAWMHILVSFDWTQSGDSNRLKFYVNGVQDTLNSCGSTGNAFQYVNVNGTTQYMGKQDGNSGPFYSHHYMAEAYFIDGTVYTPSDFTETDSITGQLIPKDSSEVLDAITLGNNGGYYNFSDTSDLGKDHSSNSNDFTAHNFVTGDAVKDSPTNNFCTLNPLQVAQYRGQASFSEGNLRMTSTSGNRGFTTGTIKAQGKIYFEVLNKSNSGFVGISDTTGVDYQRVDFYNGTPRIDGSTLSGTGQFSSGDIMGVKVDIDAKSIEFFRNNSSIYSGTYTTDVEYFPFIWDTSGGRSTDATANFGQDSSFAREKTAQGNTDANGIGDFYYPVPAGYKAICTANLPDPTIKLPNKHFDALLFNGTGNSGRSVTGLEFQPDWFWGKSRSAAFQHILYDSVRGTGTSKSLCSNQTNGEGNNSAHSNLTSFDSGGVTFGATSSTDILNYSGGNAVGWFWKAGGSASSNSDGTITSSVSANTSAGFSIVTYTGTGSAGTVGHGLGVKPDVMITKRRDGTGEWTIYHKDLDHASSTSHRVIRFNTNYQTGSSALYYGNDPTSTVQNQAAYPDLNESGETYVSYCFSEVEGYSKFGKYIGNGNSDGVFVYLGFSPAWVMYKNIEQNGGQWFIRDTKSHPDNPHNMNLAAESTQAEGHSSLIDIDLLSNGMKWRETNEGSNNSGKDYIYFAFAESPFKYSRAR